MKRPIISHILLLVLFLLPLSLSLPAQEGNTHKGLSVERAGLKQEGDSLSFRFAVRVQGKAVSGCESMMLVPELRAGHNTGGKALLFPYILINGDSRPKLNERYFALAGADKPKQGVSFTGNHPLMEITIIPSTDTVLVYETRIPYESWMDSARSLLYPQMICRPGSRPSPLALCDRVEVGAFEPYTVRPLVSFLVPTEEIKTRTSAVKDFIGFRTSKTVIDPGFRQNSQELARLDSVMSVLRDNPDVKITAFLIEGYTSPEGLYATNERISKERAAALMDYLKNKFGLDQGLFRLSHVAEDWDGLAALVLASNIEYKDRILDIIATTGIMAGREGALMRLAQGEPYRQMLREMFPELRRVEYRIDYTVRDYTIEESKSLFSRKPEDLSQLELYNLAQSYGEGSKEYADILIATIPQYYPDDVTANVNAAAVLIENGELNTAGRLLDKAATVGGAGHPTILNNRGVIALLAGELDEAGALFNRAKTAGSKEAAHNLEEVEVKRADDKKMERYKSR